MALSDGRIRSTRLAFQQDTPAEHVTLPVETGSTPALEVEEEVEEEADTDQLPPNSIWRRTLTVEEEDFLRDVGIALNGMEPGTLERWIEQNEAMYDRRNARHWYHLSWDNAEFRDRNVTAGESRELPERILASYRSVVLRDLGETESPSPAQEGPEGTADSPGPDPGLNKQGDTTQEYSPDVPVRQPTPVEAGQSTSQAGARAEPLEDREPHQHGVPGAHESMVKEATDHWHTTMVLLHREYAVTVGQMEQLSRESQQPHSVERASLIQQEWQYLGNILAGLREHLKWYSMFEAGPLHMFTLIALGMAPGAPGTRHNAVGAFGPSAAPGAAPGMNFAGFGAHLGYQFGAPMNSARK